MPSILASYLAQPVYECLSERMMNSDPFTNHVVSLNKSVAEKISSGYCGIIKLASYYSSDCAGRQFTAQIHKVSNFPWAVMAHGTKNSSQELAQCTEADINNFTYANMLEHF